MNIGQASAASGVSAKMIRHYEETGLVRPPQRTASNYRSYRDTDVHLLRFIKRARMLGFSVADIKQLLSLWQNKSRSSSAVKRIARGHTMGRFRLCALNIGRIGELQSMARTLEHLTRNCHGDHRPECPILDELAR
jgi:Cu(I)-responsive transcriptional regulator